MTTLALLVGGLLMGLSAGLSPLGASAQSVSRPAVPDAASLLPRPYSDPERSFRLLAELRRLNPEREDLHLAAAREATALGVLAPTQEERRSWLESGVEAARMAVALDSAYANAHYWLAACLGLEADEAGGREKITLAREAYDEALRALALDSLHGGAHHVVGRLHSGAKRLSWFSRLIARGLGLGEILDQASWESAEEHLRLAVRYDPGPLVHHLELAKLLVARGEGGEGRRILDTLAARQPRYPLDVPVIRSAKELLAHAPSAGGRQPDGPSAPGAGR